MEENGSLPAFLGKLWRMVNDPSTDHLIRWSQNGNTFIIKNQAQFWYDLLPLYYKHNNMSSFVRQLNLYGFRKISSIENPSFFIAADDDEDMNSIQFYHPYFQKDEIEKLKYIKRKASSTSKPQENNTRVLKNDDLTRVLSDMKHLRGRQSGVDAQLTAMKQENTVLWRELAMLRQKHVKQQQIVNKLIQFLVTLVQPTPPQPQRMTMGVKRRMPLMLHESPVAKRANAKKNIRFPSNAGPTIQELVTNLDLSPELVLDDPTVIEEDDNVLIIDSPITPSSQISQDSLSSQRPGSPTAPSPSQSLNFKTQNGQQVTSQQNCQQQLNIDFWDKPEFVIVDNDYPEDSSDHEIELIENLRKNADRVFLNPSNHNPIIPSLLSNASYNTSTAPKKPENHNKKKNCDSPKNNSNSQLATKEHLIKTSNDTLRTNDCFRDDLDLHLDHTQSELNQLKDILNGCNNFDANTLLGLFSGNGPNDGLKTATLLPKENFSEEGAPDELVSDTIVSANSIIDFSLFDEELSGEGVDPAHVTAPSSLPSESTEINTPVNTPVMITKKEPVLQRKS